MEVKINDSPNDFAQQVYWFLSGIKERLAKANWDENCTRNEVAVLATYNYPYSFDVLKLVQKRLTTKKWRCVMRTYNSEPGHSVVTGGDVTWHYYTFWMEKQ